MESVSPIAEDRSQTLDGLRAKYLDQQPRLKGKKVCHSCYHWSVDAYSPSGMNVCAHPESPHYDSTMFFSDTCDHHEFETSPLPKPEKSKVLYIAPARLMWGAAAVISAIFAGGAYFVFDSDLTAGFWLGTATAYLVNALFPMRD